MNSKFMIKAHSNINRQSLSFSTIPTVHPSPYHLQKVRLQPTSFHFHNLSLTNHQKKRERATQSPPMAALQHFHNLSLTNHQKKRERATQSPPMAALQHTIISLQSKTPSPPLSSALTPRTTTLSFSFSSTFSPLHLKLSSSALTARRNGSGSLGARMNASAAASYASALADVANSNNTLEATSGDVEKIEKFFGEPSVFDFFINPTIGLEKKRQVLDDIAKSSALQPHTINFLNILVDAKRIDLIKDIVKEFEVVYNKITDTELAIVSSVVKLESQHLAQIAKQVQKLTGAQNVRIKTEIDPSLVAGFTVRYGQSGSKLIDLSVKKQLEEIAAELDLGDIKLNL